MPTSRAEAAAAREDTSPPAADEVGLAPDHVSHLIFTSGSTGRPKGVAVRHGAVATLVSWAHRSFPADQLEGMLAATSINFDLSVFELLVPLAAGGMVILAEDALALASIPARDEVRTVNTVPSAIAELVRGGDLPASVGTVNLAGEALPGSLVEAVYASTSARAVWNLYGPSEDTTYSTFSRVPRGLASPAIGRPVAGTGAFLLDRRLQPVPLGVAGELQLAGEGLARGYWHRPALTAERFGPHPLAAVPGARAYRSGDLARYRPDGEMLFLGRTDHQVKVRGFRIELGEVEEALLRHPDLAEVVAAARGEGSGRFLVAYVVPAPGREVPAIEALRAHVGARLPSYMVPGVFVALDAIPRTPNGKVDRRRLPAPEERQGDGADTAPRTWTEELVAGIWAQVLGRRSVSIDERFFDLGGHSLLATRVVSEVRRTLGVELPIRALFDAPTVALFTARIERAQRAGADPTTPPLVRVPRTSPPPLSFAQLRFWFSQRLNPRDPGFNVPTGMRLEGPLNVPALARTLREIVRRHEVLRTTYPQVDGEPIQRIAPAEEAPGLAVVDLLGLPEAARAAEVQARIDADVARPFDLERGPILRLTLLRTEAEEHVLLAVTHHAVRDGWSGGLLRRELSKLYEAFAAGRPSPLTELPVQYADFAVWQRSWLQGEVLEAHMDYWRRQLAGAPPTLDLPFDRPLPAEPSFESMHLPIRLGGDLAAALDALGRRSGASTFMVLLAAYQLVLERWTGQGDVSVGVPIAGRTRAEIEALVGCFVNMLVMRTRFEGQPTFEELIARVRDTALGAQQHQDMPFEKLVRALQPERSLSRFPLFQAMFTFQNLPASRIGDKSTLRLSGLDISTYSMRHDLSLTLGPDSDGYRGSVTYRPELFDETTARRLRDQLETLFAAAAATPEASVVDLPVQTRSERQQLREWHHAPGLRGDAGGRRFEELFEDRAAAAPDVAAVVFGDRTLTYGALAAASRRLAARLDAAGVGAGEMVAVAVERSPDLFVAMLGTLRAGGVYLPVDPRLPRDRIEFLLADAGASAVVAHPGLTDGWPAGLPVVDLGGGSAPEEATTPSRRLPPESLAYVIYTSGSTGTPKGVGVSHAAAVAHTLSVNEAYGLRPDDRVVQYAATSFDASIEQIVPPLAAGATVVLRGSEVLAPLDMARWMERHRVTFADLPTTVWNRWALEPEASTEPPTALRMVGAGGEEMLAEAVRAWRGSELAGIGLFNGYGPTETVITAIRRELRRTPGARVPIGRPMAGRAATVVDRRGRPVPIGVAGELLLGGPEARGYLGRPALTAERFVPATDGLAAFPGARLYRTGDLARWRADGDLEFLGRVDRQVKVRGFRIELGEIEAALGRHPEVVEAAVVTRERSPGDRFLVAYVACRGEGKADAAPPPTDRDLASFLSARLPAPLVPAVYVRLAGLPISATGKIDRAALPRPEAPVRDRLAPRDDIELALARIWEDLLGAPAGVTDDFFALGGHSLLAVSLTSRIARSFGRELSLAVLFQQPTIEGLARLLRADAATTGTAEPTARVALRDSGAGAPFFCVHPVGGTVFCYLDLARCLAAEEGGDRPFVALQAATGAEAADETLEQAAARYVREVRAVQPAGPYLLGGWSFGGVVAFEMARQIEAAGDSVALLALVDSELPRPGAREPDALERLLDLARDLEGQSGRELGVDAEALRATAAGRGLDLVLERAERAGAVAPGDGARLRELAALRERNVARLYRYRPAPYGGAVTLFRAGEPDGEASAGRWQRLAAAVEVAPVPGDHYSALREPQVQSLAVALAARLRAAAPAADTERRSTSC